MNIKEHLFEMRDEYYAQGLEDLILHIQKHSDTKNMTMVEIGSYAGESTVIFAKHFKNVIAIDPFMNDYDPNDITCNYMELTNVHTIFNKAIQPFDNIQHIHKTSDDAIADLIEQKFDFIYIDGLHTYDQIKKDIRNYYPLINKGGFIGGHDYHRNWQGVVDGILETIGIPEETFKDTSWIKQVK